MYSEPSGHPVMLIAAGSMVFLFRSGTIREKFKLIFRATRTHARNLAKFATIYKLTCLVLRRLNHGKERKYDTFFAGLIGGYGVFGRGIQSSVNQQISIYVFARVVLALAKMSTQKHVVPDPNGSTTRNAWPVFASLSWAFVMYIFRWYPDMLQPSLRNSMKYMYESTIPPI